MSLNPEFRRNLWLELTPHRLIVMPLGLAGIFFLIYILNDYKFDRLSGFALSIYGIISFLWGTRLSSESVLSEVKERTWDSQRMSAIGPWTMTWGKLLGSTAFTWYGAIFCLMLYSFSAMNESSLETAKIIILFIFCGLISQSIGLVASLAGLMKKRIHSKSLTTSYMVLGIIAASFILSFTFQGRSGLLWYGIHFTRLDFALGSVLIFTAWTIFGIYRLMRSELQLKSSPWGWLTFEIFLLVYCAGLLNVPEIRKSEIVQTRLLFTYSLSIVLTYLAIFSDSKDPVLIRKIFQFIKKRAWGMAMSNMPYWVITLPVVIALGVLLLYVGPHQSLRMDLRFTDSQYIFFILSVFLFLLRDIGIILFFNFAKNRKRADMACVFYFGILYLILPAILSTLEMKSFTVLFWPRWDNLAGFSLFAGVVEIVFLSYLILKRWKLNYEYK